MQSAIDLSRSGVRRNAAGALPASGLYEPWFEHDSCGVGFIAHLDGEARHSIVCEGITILQNLQHRGAVGGDSLTGDGAGIMIQIPDGFFKRECKKLKLPEYGKYAVGMLFLPTDGKAALLCKHIVSDIVTRYGAKISGWRKVPVDNSRLGELAISTEPNIEQVFITCKSLDEADFQRKLYIIRRSIEKKVLQIKENDLSQFYICSLSTKLIVYKGLLTGVQVPEYFPDLNSEFFTSSFSIVHSRFSTNTLPEWRLAQPFRYMAHNGEINTVRGNINRQNAREGFMSSKVIGEELREICPIIDDTGSDSAIFDNVLELFTMAGRTIPHVMMMMIPEAYSPDIQMSADKRAFYEYHSTLMEPWDGPAAVVFTNGRYIGATLDRNGLRPARYTITKEGLIILASESGVIDLPPETIQSKGRLQPGKMFLVDLLQHRIVPDNEIKAKISRQFPYRRWVKDRGIELRGLFMPSGVPKMDEQELLLKQTAFGYTSEDLKTLMIPMAKQGQEAIGSMGNDAGLAILSEKPQLLFNYFKQLFAQVTNPPIDPLREQLVMSLESYIENESNPLDIDQIHFRSLKLSHPILSIRDMVRLRSNNHPDLRTADIDITFTPDDIGKNLEKALQDIFTRAEMLADEGISLLILTDKNIDENTAPIPSLLAASGLHHHMIKKGIRGKIGIIVETGEAREVFHFALLVAFGVDAICPYIAFSTVRNLAESGKLKQLLLEDALPLDAALTPESASDNYVNAIKKGLLKTFSRMGISTLHSFFGTQIFEAVGLNNDIIDKYFSGTVSRIGGIGLREISIESAMRLQKAYPADHIQPKLLEPGGAYRYRRNSEKHYWTPESIYKLQHATRSDDYSVFQEFTTLMNGYYRDNGDLRGLIKFKTGQAIPIDEVESIECITQRFVSAAMSIGSISREAHETVAVAMNRIGAKSNSGEGGEDPERYQVLDNGDSKKSRIKQVASGRFGVTTEYLMSADEIQIKMAQGAKPGEGGQLPGHKVSEYIAKIRHTTPGVTLISPPPHHDIYSIEDLAQLITDLKTVNQKAEVSVKLVSEAGVGTIASGVAKAKADRVLISGQNGGTGASPLTAIKHAGLPWELGLAETQQSLVLNNLRDKIIVQVDGHLKTGKDLAIAAMLGAEEFGFGTSILITLGCVMMRKCHLNTCPVGVATQDPELRKKFKGRAEYVVRFLRFLAQEFREKMADLGFRTVEEMVGRVDRLDFEPAIKHWKANNINLEKILNTNHITEGKPLHHMPTAKGVIKTEFDKKLEFRLKRFWTDPVPIKVTLPIRSINRTIGAALSGEIIKRFGPEGLPDDTIKLDLKGTAGQSFGAFLVPGITIHLEGDSNDYVAKGMSGGRITIVPPSNAGFRPERNIICGNVVLYGATAGEIFINGRAGERFAVRNSGATAVVEGVGDHGCEYMTGGTVVIIGSTGKNFAAGMSGGIAYVYDPTELFDTRCNLDMVDLESVWNKDDKIVLREFIEKHYHLTKSRIAAAILEDWEAQLPLFVKVIPIDYRKVLERMKMNENRDGETLSATEEVYDG
ncbi:MAG: glutamate synthase large subunit [Spirochaetales bacterium]|nr:glutamate synthase large subunit [Spirochaetales bacterium]